MKKVWVRLLTMHLALLLTLPTLGADTAALAISPSFATAVSRDGSGRISKFSDSRQREFAVTYDREGRVQAVKATKAMHVSDIRSIHYGPQGQVLGVQFQNGYALYFNRTPDGRQLVRDSRGSMVIRSGREGSYQVAGQEDPTGKLAATVADVDSLLASLKP